MFGRLLAATVMMMLFVTACASTEISRDDAIAALQTAGPTEVEATCMADTLLAIGQLDAADPRLERNVERSEAFLAARERCVSVEVLGATEGATSFAVESVGVNEGEEEESYLAEFTNAGSGVGSEGGEVAPGPDAQRTAAVVALERLGHSPERASCIVDQLVALEAWYLFTDPNFGIGLDALEANAMAACAAPS